MFKSRDVKKRCAVVKYVLGLDMTIDGLLRLAQEESE